MPPITMPPRRMRADAAAAPDADGPAGRPGSGAGRMAEQVFTNARVVLADRVVDGSVAVRQGRIADIADTPSRLPRALDLDGDYLVPGLVDLHTDNLKSHMRPRGAAPWPAMAAAIAHDTQMAGAGITTVLNALSLGDIAEDGGHVARLGDMIDALTCAAGAGVLRADHLLHLRCEVGFPGLAERLERLRAHPLLRMLSLTDRAPGRQRFESAEACRAFYRARYGFGEAEARAFMARAERARDLHAPCNRACVAELARSRRVALASHGDAVRAHVDDAVAAGASLAEFPATLEAAAVARGAGLWVSMGGPNVVRGGSHAGHVAAHELAANGCLDIVASDDVPYSQLHAAMLLAETVDGYDLAAAVRAVTKTPAEAAGLTDRGEIAVARRADLVRLRPLVETPLVREVWRAGRRVA